LFTRWSGISTWGLKAFAIRLCIYLEEKDWYFI
jgi:hypothetical protein